MAVCQVEALPLSACPLPGRPATRVQLRLPQPAVVGVGAAPGAPPAPLEPLSKELLLSSLALWLSRARGFRKAALGHRSRSGSSAWRLRDLGLALHLSELPFLRL